MMNIPALMMFMNVSVMMVIMVVVYVTVLSNIKGWQKKEGEYQYIPIMIWLNNLAYFLEIDNVVVCIV